MNNDSCRRGDRGDRVLYREPRAIRASYPEGLINEMLLLPSGPCAQEKYPVETNPPTRNQRITLSLHLKILFKLVLLENDMIFPSQSSRVVCCILLLESNKTTHESMVYLLLKASSRDSVPHCHQ